MRTRFYDLLERDLPAWYEFDSDGTACTLRVHPAALAGLTASLDPRNGTTEEFERELGLTPFVPLDQDRPGFAGILERQAATEDGWPAWKCLLPAYRKKERAPDLAAIFAVTATFSCLFRALNYADLETCPSPRRQLFCLNSHVRREGMMSAPLDVQLSPSFCRWLGGKRDHEPLPAVTAAMRAAASRIFVFGCASEAEARVRHPKYAILETSIDCGIGPDFCDPAHAHAAGGALVPSNLDGAAQQLPLLAGLGALHRLARAEGI